MPCGLRLLTLRCATYTATVSHISPSSALTDIVLHILLSHAACSGSLAVGANQPTDPVTSDWWQVLQLSMLSSVREENDCGCYEKALANRSV